MFRSRLENQIDLRHPLARLSQRMPWTALEQALSSRLPATQAGGGRPALPVRLIAGLLYLKHAYDLSDEAVCERWLENPYWQFFTGEVVFQTRLPCDASSLTRWRQRLGEAGMEELLAHTINAAHAMQAVDARELSRVIVDTTVQEKAIAYPTDSRLLEVARKKLVLLAKMRRVLRRQRTVLGRLMRDIQRKLDQVNTGVREHIAIWLERAQRLCTQRPKDKQKPYALHAPEVECIGKGKARQAYEFGVKVGIAVTACKGLVVGARSFPGTDGTWRLKGIFQGRLTTQPGNQQGHRAGRATDPAPHRHRAQIPAIRMQPVQHRGNHQQAAAGDGSNHARLQLAQAQVQRMQFGRADVHLMAAFHLLLQPTVYQTRHVRRVGHDFRQPLAQFAKYAPRAVALAQDAFEHRPRHRPDIQPGIELATDAFDIQQRFLQQDQLRLQRQLIALRHAEQFDQHLCQRNLRQRPGEVRLAHRARGRFQFVDTHVVRHPARFHVQLGHAAVILVEDRHEVLG
ncbi:IS1478 transposase [Xanthomonas fragariae LMG 25863]|nr:IS1478 transposase [Xanthomonas fragariae LMG 25863]